MIENVDKQVGIGVLWEALLARQLRLKGGSFAGPRDRYLGEFFEAFGSTGRVVGWLGGLCDR